MRYRQYSVVELKALDEIMHEFGEVRYDNDFNIEKEFYDRTGEVRKSGPLYMCCWRIKHGYYGDIA